MHYHWPGNVRELENLVERELIRHQGGQLKFDCLLLEEKCRESLSVPEAPVPAPEAPVVAPLNLDEVISQHITKVLKMTKGKINGPGGAAELLGTVPNTLRGRMDKLGITYGTKKGKKPTSE